MGMVKAHIPAAICFVALVYCCWMLYRSKHTSILQDPETRVEITVHGPDGTVIPAVGPADAPPDSDPKSRVKTK
jgi:hypothetical protein